MFQELRSSGILDLFFVCAKSEVHQVSQPAVNCLVLIWQWYLRRSPTASFSMNQMSCFFPEEPTPTVEGAAAAAVVTGQKALTTAVANGSGRQLDSPQLWSVVPVVDYAIDRAGGADCSSHAVERKAGPTASKWQTGRTSSHALRSSTDSYFKPWPPVRSSTDLRSHTDLCPTPGMMPARSSTDARSNLRGAPVRAPPPPTTSAAVRVSSGSLPAFRSSREAVLAAPRQPSSASEHPAQEQAPPPCLSPLQAFIKPRVSSDAPPAAAPLEGGQFVPQPHDQISAASSSSSSSAQEPSATEQKAAASNSNRATADDSFGKLPKQLTGSIPLTASKNQRASSHSLSSPDSHRVPSSMCSPCHSRSYREVKEAPITPDQLAGHFSRMRINAKDVPWSSSSLRAAADQVSGAKPTGALDHTPPQGNSSQHIRDIQAVPIPAAHIANQPVTQQRQPDPSKHKQSCLDTDPEGHWHFMFQSRPLPSVQARAEGHNMQCYGGLERQSPAESPPTPEHRRPNQRVLPFSPKPGLPIATQGEGLHVGRRPTNLATELFFLKFAC